MTLDIPIVEQQLSRRDTMLYALAVGLGCDPVDPRQLRYVYEKDLAALPTMATILGYPGAWFRGADTGITPTHVVHGEQGFVIHKPLPVEGAVTGKTRVVDVWDKGADKGAVIDTVTEVADKASGEPICTLTASAFCRKDGGFGGPAAPARPAPRLPDRPPDQACELPTLPQSALLYRLLGDDNPLHADPAFAAKAGFARPILHGRASFAVAGHAILQTYCDYDASRLQGMQARFVSPVYPGETIRTEMWREGAYVVYRCSVAARKVTVLGNGFARILPSSATKEHP